MKPTPDLVLNHAFAKIAMEMGPALPQGYGQGSATLTGVLLLMVAQEFNRAADIRAKENAAMRALFAGVSASIGGDLGERLRTATSTTDDDLNIGVLDRANGEIKTVLIELHRFAEEKGERGLELQILKLLSQAATARQVFLPAM